MKKERNELLEFLGGLAMLVVGLYLFTNKASVQTSFFAGNLRLFGLNVNSGLVIIPFIIGVVWLFVKPSSFGAKLVTGLGVLLIIVSVIASTTIRLQRLTLFEWILYLVLIFGGAGLLARALLGGNSKEDRK